MVAKLLSSSFSSFCSLQGAQGSRNIHHVVWETVKCNRILLCFKFGLVFWINVEVCRQTVIKHHSSIAGVLSAWVLWLWKGERTKLGEVGVPLMCNSGFIYRRVPQHMTFDFTVLGKQCSWLLTNTNIYSRAWPPSRPCFMLKGVRWSSVRGFLFPSLSVWIGWWKLLWR